MQQRRPRTALQTSALPSLAALLASGVVVEGCATPTADADRGERLSRHGENAARAFRDNRLGDAMREIGVGLGLIDSPTGVGDIGPAGAAPATTNGTSGAHSCHCCWSREVAVSSRSTVMAVTFGDKALAYVRAVTTPRCSPPTRTTTG